MPIHRNGGPAGQGAACGSAFDLRLVFAMSLRKDQNPLPVATFCDRQG
jgi:hypothetical protein